MEYTIGNFLNFCDDRNYVAIESDIDNFIATEGLANLGKTIIKNIKTLIIKFLGLLDRALTYFRKIKNYCIPKEVGDKINNLTSACASIMSEIWITTSDDYSSISNKIDDLIESDDNTFIKNASKSNDDYTSFDLEAVDTKEIIKNINIQKKWLSEIKSDIVSNKYTDNDPVVANRLKLLQKLHTFWLATLNNYFKFGRLKMKTGEIQKLDKPIEVEIERDSL